MRTWRFGFVFLILTCSVVLPLLADDEVWTLSFPSLNLREQPDISAKVVAKVPYGTHLKALVTANAGKSRWSEWRRVEYMGNQGWVYNVFLSGYPVEPLVDITVLPASKGASLGNWYFFSPFGVGLSKFPRGEVAASSGLTFEKTGKLVVHDYDGNSGGNWILEGSNITIRADGSEDQYSGFEISGAAQFYKVRDDWMILEITSEDKIGDKIQPRFYFMTRPLNTQTAKEVEEWIARETR